MNPIETLWQVEACDQGVVLLCRTDGMGFTRVVEVPALFHYMKGWLIDDVARYARRSGWRFSFVA
ncbi:MAG: hypothetical protein AMJ69_11930 [Gammaproteobacteria bacterium SG8_47]|nr:MAG: hypothetical protein AMJ69_11930 [Gammaproteobacteria bacterium SG8_47]